MDVLLGVIFARTPHTHVFLSSIVGLPEVNTCYYWTQGQTDQRSLGKAFNGLLPGLVEKYLARGDKITLVHMLNDTSVGVDGEDVCPCHIHPTDHGYDKMGQELFKSISAHFEF
jgi:hypothetical protein